MPEVETMILELQAQQWDKTPVMEEKRMRRTACWEWHPLSIAVNVVLLMSVTKPVSSPNGIMNLKKTFIKMLRRFINLHIVNMSQHHHIVRSAQCDLGKLGVFLCKNFQFH